MERGQEYIKNKFMEQMDLYTAISDRELLERIDQLIIGESKRLYISLIEKEQCRKELFDAIRRLGILQELLDDPDITEIMINGSKNIFIEQKGRISLWKQQFSSNEDLEDIIQRMVSRVNRMVNERTPIVDARLEDGSRVNVVLPPVAIDGPVVTIRKFKQGVSMPWLIEKDMLPVAVARFLEKLVAAGYNLFISGGTSSGKTTFLNALSEFIPEQERVITIEDSAELQIKGIPNLVRLETRNTNIEGKNEIAMDALIRTALRARPDRIIVGEVRGKEALDMLQAMNTGHDGSLSTGHANSVKDMLSRLETMVLQGAEGLPLEAIRQQISSGIDIIIHLSRLRDHSRKIMEICEVLDYENGQIKLNPLYVFKEDDGSTLEKVSGSLIRTENPLQNNFKLTLMGYKNII